MAKSKSNPYRNIYHKRLTINIGRNKITFEPDEVKYIPCEKSKVSRFLVKVDKSQYKKKPKIKEKAVFKEEEKDLIDNLEDMYVVLPDEDEELPDYFPEEFLDLVESEKEDIIEKPDFLRLSTELALEYCRKLEKYYDGGHGSIAEVSKIQNKNNRRLGLVKIVKSAWKSYEERYVNARQ